MYLKIKYMRYVTPIKLSNKFYILCQLKAL